MNKESPHLLNENLVKLGEKYQLVYQKLLEKKEVFDASNKALNLDEIYSSLFLKIFDNPDKLLTHNLHYLELQTKLISNISDRFLEHKNLNDIYVHEARDNRFKDELWNESAIFNYIKQSYLMSSIWFKDVVKDVVNPDATSAKKIDFYVSRFLDALAPTNFPATNPKVLKEISETSGENLIKGLDNLIRDLDNSNEFFKIKSHDDKNFEIGKNIATSKGNVIFQNHLMQLIHYKPLVKMNYEVPLLIVPPFINKFYILDLSKQNSYINWLLEQGYNVYLISWVNPTAKLANKNFENYMLEGPVAAINAIRKDSDKEKVSIVGYCIGGTLLSCTLSYLKAKKKDYVVSATFLTTLIDFKNAGDLGLFLDDQQIAKIEDHVKKTGFFDGKEMAMTFDLLKANDMIWSFYINNYLLGKEPFPFDILYWNSDSTRLTASMHIFYLKNMYKDNLLKTGNLVLAKEKIDLTKIDIPCYFLSCLEDHIAPWKATFFGSKIIKNMKFVLSSSGHVAGVVNHPNKNKYCYWENNESKVNSSKWLKNASKHEGSWWPNWDKWNKKKSGKLVRSRFKGNLDFIESAPGSYVKEK